LAFRPPCHIIGAGEIIDVPHLVREHAPQRCAACS
jgi:hypothetical protein